MKPVDKGPKRIARRWDPSASVVSRFGVAAEHTDLGVTHWPLYLVVQRVYTEDVGGA